MMLQPKTIAEGFLNRDYTYFLRGLCMIAIVFAHTANEFMADLVCFHLGNVVLCGQFATAVFFFLSGYGLTLSIKRNSMDGKYVWRHLRNLLVPYVIFWMCYTFVGLCAGDFPVNHALYMDFLMLKMPNADAWFFRTILGIYIVYFLMVKCCGKFAQLCIAVMILLYVGALAWCGVPNWWWNTIICFPLGILCAEYPSCHGRMSSLKVLALMFLLFVVFQRFVPFNFVRETLPPVFCCLFCAGLSVRVRVPRRSALVVFVGQNSLYMYLMEAIPIDYVSPGQAGFFLYVVGGIVATIALTYVGKKIEALLA